MNVTLYGVRVGQDPKLAYTKQGSPVLKMSVAENRKQKDGEQETSWWNVTVWGSKAERLAKLAKKGTQLVVMGEGRNNKWTNKEGQTVVNFEVNAMLVYLVQEIQNDEGTKQTQSDSASQAPQQGSFADDDVGF